MILNLFSYRCVLTGLIAMVMVMTAPVVFAAGNPDGFSPAKKIETRHFTLMLESGVDEDSLAQTLNVGLEYKVLASLAGVSNKREMLSSYKLGDLVDALFVWASGVLDMRIDSYKGIIKVVRGQSRMNDIYRSIYGVEGRSDKGFYIQEYNTVYLPAESFTKEILGHELAHVIINNFFVVQPPGKVQEVLAGYIEYQLRKTSR